MSRIIVTGGAGFIGTHLCRRLIGEGHDVLCIDSLISGRRENLADLEATDSFEFREQDVSEPLSVSGKVDVLYDLATPASPIDYMNHPVETLRACSLGTLNQLDLAAKSGATFVLTSTSEVYGDPEIHPQKEDYWGNVNPVGPRAPYDEGKRFAEAATMAWHRLGRARVRIARIFNTYGPGMRRDDGRVIPTFIDQALQGAPLTVFGDGSQTRSLCYVEDMVSALIALSTAPDTGPYNLGNPEELTVLEIAKRIVEMTGSASKIETRPLPQDDPKKRRPDISRAKADLGWAPAVTVEDGLRRTIESFERKPA